MRYNVRQVFLLSVVLAVCLGASAPVPADPVKLVIGGRPAHFPTTPIRQGDDIYVPFTVLDALGAKVSPVGKPDGGLQKVKINSAGGREFECKARVIEDRPMLPIRDIADELGAHTEWNRNSGTLSIRANIQSIAFDGTRLQVSTSYPVMYLVTRWTAANKLILDVSGAKMPSNPERVIRNTSSAGVRTGTREDGETGRIVLDLPKLTKHQVESGPKTSKIVVAITPSVSGRPVSGKPSGSSLIPSGRAVSSGQEHPTEQTSTAPGPNASEPPKLAPPVLKPGVATGTAPARPAEPPAQITDVICHRRSSRSVEIEVRTSKPVAYQTWMYRGPDRVYLDIKNAVLSRGFDDWTEDHEIVRGVRTMQQNKALVRIAVDLSRVAAPVVRQDKSPCRLVMSLDPPKASGGSLASKVIVVDPGHGGIGSAGRGALGCNGTLEKVVNMEIAQRVDQLLKEQGACSLLTRYDDDTYVEVGDRPLFAKRHSADLFLSIHNNSCGKLNSMSGTETYFHRWDPNSRALATCVHSEVIAVTGLPDNEARSDLVLAYKNGLGVLRASTAYGIPAALLEVAYINHAGDEKLLNDSEFQEKVAEAIVRGLRAYVEGNPSEPEEPTVEKPQPTSDSGSHKEKSPAMAREKPQ